MLQVGRKKERPAKLTWIERERGDSSLNLLTWSLFHLKRSNLRGSWLSDWFQQIMTRGNIDDGGAHGGRHWAKSAPNKNRKCLSSLIKDLKSPEETHLILSLMLAIQCRNYIASALGVSISEAIPFQKHVPRLTSNLLACQLAHFLSRTTEQWLSGPKWTLSWTNERTNQYACVFDWHRMAFYLKHKKSWLCKRTFNSTPLNQMLPFGIQLEERSYLGALFQRKRGSTFEEHNRLWKSGRVLDIITHMYRPEI